MYIGESKKKSIHIYISLCDFPIFLLTILGMFWRAWDLERRKNDLWECGHGTSRSHPRASPPIWLTGQSPAWKGLLLQKSSTKNGCVCVCDSTCGPGFACSLTHGTTAQVCHTSSTWKCPQRLAKGGGSCTCNLRGRPFQESVQSKSLASQKASIWVLHGLSKIHLQELIDQNPSVILPNALQYLCCITCSDGPSSRSIQPWQLSSCLDAVLSTSTLENQEGVPDIGVPQNGWFISWKIPLKWMIWGKTHFRKTPIGFEGDLP